ncbi:RHS repeat-associated core domain-containing protein, partial [Burkholderia sp. GbtcB21]|uniref:RHS repeat-associated core domain-containing protein n=1 Tax=Burkholderia sp. GbtcB21 TaxID=2824766 RepID=UPI001C2F86AD
LDQHGQRLSAEEYYPYGGTAVWLPKSAVEGDYKFVRHAGKERDVTGLYDYGYRHYAPWLARWLTPDPAGTIDGLNLYRMVRNNPGTLRDSDGRQPGGGNPTAEAAASSYESERFQLSVSRTVALAARAPFAQTLYQKAKGFDVQAYHEEKHKYSKEGHFKVIEIASDKAMKYQITSNVVTRTLGKYEELALAMKQEFQNELTPEEKENFSISARLSRQYAGMVEEVGDVYSYVLINKHDEALERGEPMPIYGVISYLREDRIAILGAVVSHPLTQIPNRLRMNAGFQARLSELLTRKGIAAKPADFQLKGVGSTLTNLSIFKMIKTHHISEFKTEAINPRSGHIAHKFGMKPMVTQRIQS